METLKASISPTLRTLILSTTTLDLTASCAALDQHFSSSLHFSQLLEQLTSTDLTCCAKDAVGSADWKREGNAAFVTQSYRRALSCYSKALRFAPLASDEDSRVFQATLFVNRAAALHAWYRRGLAKSGLKDFEGAFRDMEGALTRETTTEGRLQIKRELMQMEASRGHAHGSQHAPLSSFSLNAQKESSGASSKVTELRGIGAVQKHWTEEKGWGLQTREDLPIGSLVFQEDPFAAVVVVKSCRDTHCHFCFELLPPDSVACSGCAIPLYCSDICRTQAACSADGLNTQPICADSKQNGPVPPGSVASSDSYLFQKGSPQLLVQKDLKHSSQRWGEHIPECGGSSWSAVLPTEAVLGARMLFSMACIENGVLKTGMKVVKGSGVSYKVDTLCNHYENLSPNDKLELHVLGVVIAHCLQHSGVPLLETGTRIAAVASKLIGLIARVRVNAMAIVGMSSPDFVEDPANCGVTTNAAENVFSASTSLCAVEQIKVALGIFLVGSRLNHSCVPNVHASFALGRLSIHAITSIKRDSTLELSYGPQVGEQSQLERKVQLQKGYFFTCTCPACSELTSPDLFLRSFRCAKPGCMGVVLGAESLNLSVTGFSSKCKEIEYGQETGNRGAVRCNFQKVKGKQSMTQHSVAARDSSLIAEDFAKASLHCGENIGHCLACGTVMDIEAADGVAATASSHLDRVESDLLKAEVDKKDLKGALKGALKALDCLRATVHAYNRELAKGEDIVARLFCVLDQPRRALNHCQRSIEVLEHLYNKQHIVIGNEHLKLASIALMASDVDSAKESLTIVDQIFSAHYGPDYRNRLSYVVHLEQMLDME